MSKKVKPKVSVENWKSWGEDRYNEMKERAKNFCYFIEYGDEVTDAYSKVLSYLEKNFKGERGYMCKSFKIESRSDLKEFYARLIKFGFCLKYDDSKNQYSRFYTDLKLVRSSISHSARKKYGIIIDICGTENEGYSIELSMRTKILKTWAKSNNAQDVFKTIW